MLSYKIDDSLEIIYVKPKGDFRLDDILSHINQLAVDPEFKLGVNAFYDFTEVEHVEGNLECLLKVANRMEDHEVITLGSNVSIVVANKNIYRIFEGYCLMVSNSLVKYRIFWQEEMAEAMQWVNLKELPNLK